MTQRTLYYGTTYTLQHPELQSEFIAHMLGKRGREEGETRDRDGAQSVLHKNFHKKFKTIEQEEQEREQQEDDDLATNFDVLSVTSGEKGRDEDEDANIIRKTEGTDEDSESDDELKEIFNLH